MYGNTKRRLCRIRESQKLQWMERQKHIVSQLLEYPPGADFDVFVSQKEFVTLDFVLQNPGFVVWDWYSLSCHQNITFDDFLKNPYLPWDVGALSLNENINLEIVMSHPDIGWSWPDLSVNRGIPIQEIVSHKELDWAWISVSYREDLTLKIVLENPEIEWDMRGVATLARMTEAELEEHPELDLKIYDLVCNQSLSLGYLLDKAEREHGGDIQTLCDIFYSACSTREDEVDEVMRYSEKEYFNYFFVSRLSKLTFNDLQRLGHCVNWDWRQLSWGEGIIFSDILENLHLPWEWGHVIVNPNLTWDDIICFNEQYSFLAVWNVSTYIQNDMTHERNTFFQNLYREHMAAFRIQCYFRKAYYEPKYAICKRRLNREYDEAMAE